ncbi:MULTISPECIES: glyoxalase superfamily protein [Ochrobactrum]|uniref:Glyoxalase superfamily protein n=1 Tax=Ochrobactrum chromiisoli TaxID=2993941 RepID=A0ABT3QPM9_9HYPH|nr:glyoxalase superfamily protein [Ochrobactrum chromiisoli]MCX2697573.1 glyoxalase superfamily protein [Ochrobactrum chromiisoli]
MTTATLAGHNTTHFKHQARRLRQALGEEGIQISHGKALDLVARQSGTRDWNTLAAYGAKTDAAHIEDGAAPYRVSQRVSGTFHSTVFKARIIAVEETIKPDLWRITLQFDPAIDVAVSPNLTMLRRRYTVVVGADGKARRLTGSEAGGIALDMQ